MLQVISLSVPDELYEVFVKQNPQNPHKAIVKHLEKFKEFKFSDRAIVLSGSELEEVQRAAGKTIETPQELLTVVRDALSLDVDGMKVTLTEGQRARIKHTATFFGQKPEEFGATKVREALAAQFGV